MELSAHAFSHAYAPCHADYSDYSHYADYSSCFDSSDSIEKSSKFKAGEGEAKCKAETLNGITSQFILLF